MARMTVAKLAVMVSGLEARMVAVERAMAARPTRTEQQQAATLAELGTRMTAVEAAVAGDETPVIIRHTSRGVLPVDPAVPDLGGMQQQFAHYRLPAGVKRGEVRIARITGQGTKGRGYANLRVELNGDEGWGDVPLWLVVSNAPFSRGTEADTWGIGS